MIRLNYIYIKYMYAFVYYSSACAIPNEDTVIITGGSFTKTTVSVYNVEGWQYDLPPLNTGR